MIHQSLGKQATTTHNKIKKYMHPVDTTFLTLRRINVTTKMSRILSHIFTIIRKLQKKKGHWKCFLSQINDFFHSDSAPFRRALSAPSRHRTVCSVRKVWKQLNDADGWYDLSQLSLLTLTPAGRQPGHTRVLAVPTHQALAVPAECTASIRGE